MGRLSMVPNNKSLWDFSIGFRLIENKHMLWQKLMKLMHFDQQDNLHMKCEYNQQK